MKLRVFLVGIWLGSMLTAGLAQVRSDLQLLRDVKWVEIPFVYENNFIVVDVLLNNLFPLRFIVDTGAENTILTQRSITDLLQVDYRRTFNLVGADLSTPLTAYLATGMSMRLGTNLLATNRSVLVLEEDYFRFSEFAGIDVQGILGADFLNRFIVEINYRKRRLILHDPSTFEGPGRDYHTLKLEMRRYRPYLTLPVLVGGGKPEQQLKFLLDTGAGVPLIIHANTDSTIQLPSQVITAGIGMGLGGFMNGLVGRTQTVEMGSRTLEDVITYYHDVPQGIDSAYLNHRNGILGNLLLDRFSVIINYITGELYLKPTRQARRRFEYDRSGLVLARNSSQTALVVLNVLPGSPSAEAGVQPGDVVLSINGVSTRFLSLGNAQSKLRKRPGKRTKLKIRREEERIYVTFRLRDLI